MGLGSEDVRKFIKLSWAVFAKQSSDQKVFFIRVMMLFVRIGGNGTGGHKVESMHLVGVSKHLCPTPFPKVI